jgi:hypothetical protein
MPILRRNHGKRTESWKRRLQMANGGKSNVRGLSYRDLAFPEEEISSSPPRVNTKSKHSRDWQLIELECVQMPDTF